MYTHFSSNASSISSSKSRFISRFTLSLPISLAALATASAQSPADEPVHLENMVVTASPFSRDQAELASATNVLAGQNLLLAQQSSLGATLDGQPGIASTWFGPGASRPVIRGLGGDRVRVLNNGAGVFDASVASPDHAVAIEPLLARRIEVVRGPATLLYGSNAVGGIVNVIDARIPGALPASALTGRAGGRYGTAAAEWTGLAAFDGALGNSLAWHAEGLRREADDVRIPGYANPDEPENRGTLTNSAVSTTAYSGGLSFVSGAGYIGASARRFETDYGAVAEPDVTIRLVEKSYDLAGELTRPFGIFSGARAKFTASDYKHTEFEDTEPGTVFKNKALEGRLELLHEKLARRLDGSWGFQYTRSDFSALGEEAFLPPSITQNTAVFLFEELPLHPVTLQFGARAEKQRVTTDNDRRNDSVWSASLGAVLALDRAKTWTLSASFARSERAPNAQELFADGPHAGTNAYEIGDPDLAHEKSLGFDLGLRKKAGRVTGALTLFANRFDGFIFEQATGAINDDMPEYAYTQHDALFYGAELELIFHLHQSKSHSLDLELTADTVRAEDRTTRDSLPRITPGRAGIALEYRGSAFSAGLAVRTAERARHLAPGETPTAGHGLLGAHVSYRLPLGKRIESEFFVRGENLAGQEARNHVSFLKDIAPMPGRNVTLGVRFVF
jgi:iron complex outermembrane receptor protein